MLSATLTVVKVAANFLVVLASELKNFQVEGPISGEKTTTTTKPNTPTPKTKQKSPKTKQRETNKKRETI